MTSTTNPGTNAVLGGGGFHHVALRARDFDASLAFYVGVLGFKESLAWGSGDGRAVMLDTGDGNFLEIFSGRKQDAQPDGALLHLALRTTRCDAVVELVRAAGMPITLEPKDVDVPSTPPSHIRIAFFKGPDGEIIELFQYR